MRNPIEVLKTLQEKANDKNYHFERLYRNLYNEDFYLLAYGNLYNKEGNMTRGTDNTTIDGMGLDRLTDCEMTVISPVRQNGYIFRNPMENNVRWVFLPSMINWYRKW